MSGTPACSRRRQCGQEQVSWSAMSPPDSLLSLSCPLEPCPWWHQLPRTLEREMLLQVFPNLECKCENMGFATERSEHSCSSAVPRRLSLTNDFASLNLSFPFRGFAARHSETMRPPWAGQHAREERAVLGNTGSVTDRVYPHTQYEWRRNRGGHSPP